MVEILRSRPIARRAFVGVAGSSLLFGAVLFSGCGTNAKQRAQLPITSEVCVVLERIEDPGRSYAQRRAEGYLKEYGYRSAQAACDVTITYTAFSHKNWEMIEVGLLGSRSKMAWRSEGTLAIRRGDALVIQDERVDLRDYGSEQDLLYGLSGAIFDTVQRYYRSPTEVLRRQ